MCAAAVLSSWTSVANDNSSTGNMTMNNNTNKVLPPSVAQSTSNDSTLSTGVIGKLVLFNYLYFNHSIPLLTPNAFSWVMGHLRCSGDVTTMKMFQQFLSESDGLSTYDKT